MKKSDFIKLVQFKSGDYSRKDANIALNSVLEALEEVLVKQDTISFGGFGTFSTVFTKGKTGIIPGSTKTWVTEDAMTPKFKFSSKLRDAVANNK